jgi:hypothetical protein
VPVPSSSPSSPVATSRTVATGDGS